MDILLDWRELFKQGLPLTNIIEAKLKSAFLKIGKVIDLFVSKF